MADNLKEKIRTNPINNLSPKSYSFITRILHWSIAISFALLLVTIFLRLTWMNKENIADILQSQLATQDQTISNQKAPTRDQLILIAKQIRKPMWTWHIYIGYMLVGLFSIRMILPFFGEMKFTNPFQKNHTAQEKFQYSIYLIFYIFVFVSLTTGLLIEFGPKSWKDPMESIHVLSIYYLLIYIFLHLGGVLRAEFTKQPGIISKMINGK
jgi:cytochrome b561